MATGERARPSGVCDGADESPDDAKLNGTLGIDYFVRDCGSTCADYSNNGMYYSCSGSTCSETAVPLASQVQNPVALLPLDNNGFYVQFPNVPSGGSDSVEGYLVLGIGTRSNNTPGGVNAYLVDEYGEFSTTFGGNYYYGFADTGSNGLFFGFPPASLPDCNAPYSAWFCPSSTTSFFATNTGALGSPSGSVSFRIGNFVSLWGSSHRVFDNIGGDFGLDMFDWGLPFFFGRKVYIGIEGRESDLGTGPYIAY